MKKAIKDIKNSLSLGWSLARNSISAKYRRSFASQLWMLVPPLLTTIAFTFAEKLEILNSGAKDVPYPLFALTGTTLWILAAECLEGPTAAFENAKSYVTKVRVDQKALITSQIVEILFQHAIRIMMVLLLFGYYGHQMKISGLMTYFSWSFVLVLFCVGLGAIIMPLNLMVPDFHSAFKLILGYGLFLVPAVYKVDLAGLAGDIFNLNPLAFTIVKARDGILMNESIDLLANMMWVPGGFVLCFLGLWVYGKALPHVIDRTV